MSLYWQLTQAQEHNKSCFMNMIDFYLLEAVVPEFQKFSHVHFSAPAGQVTQHYK